MGYWKSHKNQVYILNKTYLNPKENYFELMLIFFYKTIGLAETKGECLSKWKEIFPNIKAMERVIKQIIDKLDSIKHVKWYFLNAIILKWQTGKIATNKIKVNTLNVQSILTNLKIHWKKH